ncbi:MAG: hypothetical protein LBL91_05570 [Lachnospiraceae bacterium]|jgi:hypothetical protein|nr:hypothetical protein [Lachnospiraceae bacterium]
MEEENVITYEEVEKRLKNVKLEDMTEQDMIDRYVAYGTTEELEDIKIQRLFIKKGLVEAFVFACYVNVVTDKQLVEGIISSNYFEDKNISYVVGRITKADFIEGNKSEAITHGINHYYVEFEFVDRNNKTFRFKETRKFFEEEYIEDYKKKINRYKDNIIAILEKREDGLYVQFFCKYYKGI